MTRREFYLLVAAQLASHPEHFWRTTHDLQTRALDVADEARRRFPALTWCDYEPVQKPQPHGVLKEYQC